MAQFRYGSQNYEAYLKASLDSGEDESRDWRKTVNGAAQNFTVRSGTSRILGVSGGQPGDYIATVIPVIRTPANSQIILQDIGVASLVTGTTGASGTTTSVSVASIAGLTQDQYKDHVLNVAGFPPRVITAHSASPVTSFSVDHAYATAPGTGLAVSIENIDGSFELLPAGVTGPVAAITVNKESVGGWKVSSDIGVVALISASAK